MVRAASLCCFALYVGVLGACGDDDEAPVDAGRDGGVVLRDAGTDMPRDAHFDWGVPPNSLEVQALGVQGFVLSYGGESVMTAPLFTRQSTINVGLRVPLTPDVPAIDAALAETALARVRAIVSGHAHFDHLMDVPHILGAAPDATLYANRSAAHILAALAPDRDPSCTSAPPVTTIARSRVVALDDPANSQVDYTNCPDQQPPGAPREGSWVTVPGTRIRLMPVCTTHPAQVGGFHFGEGSVDADLCELPPIAAAWLEGQTISFVIDFLDDAGEPEFRVYYQDAPATRPVGEVPAAILAERRVDLAILCVGTYDAVENQPTDVIANLNPRFVFSGHWEDFFTRRDRPLQNIPLLDVGEFVMRADAALTEPADAQLIVDGERIDARQVLIIPGSRLVVPQPP